MDWRRREHVVQHLEDIFGTAHLIEPIVYQCGSVGRGVVSHAGLDSGIPPNGMKKVGFGL